ncbi:bifunctional adenosylcobinamide kinase/adenosylcobinamide-phosphate guanylyltransferase [Pseudooceanicola onchidii]|uniref:bifunctional adenosylcobinamide kinase/adenosylcobinamide-phosphate guanylyltransferase n=1 Tax=Pseudooceanicola onchidii TaxID=2562279 RepID=UPI0010AB22F8|nr:bifunctional adenosylcobinamide kinase/adenosylcobinamide-phosphate guanylyltransferase [Pseudooceanicola onchidii]
MTTPLTLVLGGAASGKSGFAEGLVTATARPRTYIATAQAFDAEMTAKIARHREMRGTGWTTIEAPVDLARALAQAPADHIILIDCLTLWLTNLLLADRDVEAATDDLIDTLAKVAAPVVMVSNEVGQGIVPETALARRFREAQGRLNIRMAARADTVIHVVAGLPNVLKGVLP